MAAKASERFTTMKVPARLHRWLKLEAAKAGKPMYKLLEELLAEQGYRRADVSPH